MCRVCRGPGGTCRPWCSSGLSLQPTAPSAASPPEETHPAPSCPGPCPADAAAPCTACPGTPSPCAAACTPPLSPSERRLLPERPGAGGRARPTRSGVEDTRLAFGVRASPGFLPWTPGALPARAGDVRPRPRGHLRTTRMRPTAPREPRGKASASVRLHHEASLRLQCPRHGRGMLGLTPS